jgi:kynureninase
VKPQKHWLTPWPIAPHTWLAAQSALPPQVHCPHCALASSVTSCPDAHALASRVICDGLVTGSVVALVVPGTQYWVLVLASKQTKPSGQLACALVELAEHGRLAAFEPTDWTQTSKGHWLVKVSVRLAVGAAAVSARPGGLRQAESPRAATPSVAMTTASARMRRSYAAGWVPRRGRARRGGSPRAGHAAGGVRLGPRPVGVIARRAAVVASARPGQSRSVTTALDPLALRPHYRQFLTVPDGAPRRVLLTGHSHQAWPDVARAGQDEAFVDAALHVDDKWGRVFALQDELRGYIAERIGARPRELALAASTHELVARFLSALDLRARPHLVTTTGEFHSLDRQLRRLAETGVEITWVDAAPVDSLAERLAAAVRDDTAAVLASTVLFETAAIVPNLAAVTAAARRRGAQVLFDAYHAWHVVPFSLADLGGDEVFVVAGGYKYAQWGEGVCFLRVPPGGAALRPQYTGWFAGFAELDAPRDRARPTAYQDDGASAFAGSTFEPASSYRAVAVTRFARDAGLELPRLRALSLAQTQRLIDAATAHGLILATPREPARRGGFVAIETPRATALVTALRAEGIYADARGHRLRLGPAPYVTDDELDLGVATVARLLA